jgi:formylglycine-generating enzyme required for sulfatase activity
LPSVDLLAYFDDVKSLTEAIDAFDYSTARARTNLLKDKYADLIAAKLANLDRIQSLRKRCFERVNSGAAKVSMEDVSKRYAFAGEILGVDEKGLKAKISKPWSAFTKEEIGNFYRKAADPKEAEEFIALAAFLMEGRSSDKELQQATDALGQAAGLKADVSAHMKYIETLKQAAKEYAEAVEKGKALGTAEGAEKEKKGSGFGVQGSGTAKAETPEKAEGSKQKAGTEKISAESAPSAVKSFDDVYVATAATGDKIPHPLSKKAKRIIYMGKKVEIAEGMVYVPAGEFVMGEGKEPPNGPEHKVYLDAYFIGKYEVTNAEWKAFTDATGFTPLPNHWKGGNTPEGKENHPVVYVSWEDAQKYCEWVSKETGREVKLTTEAQWEKAASWDFRKRHKNLYPWGDDSNPKLCNGQWLCASKFGLKVSSDGTGPEWGVFTKTDKYKEMANAGGYTTPVGSFAHGKSPYGCYDIGGNVWEWCIDWYERDYYTKSPRRNPSGPLQDAADVVAEVNGKARVLRGGSWQHYASYMQGAKRICQHVPTMRSDTYGFRVVVVVGGAR